MSGNGLAAMRMELQLPAEPRAVPSARHSLASLSRLIATDILESLELLVTELVTNSVRHAELQERDRIEVIVEMTGSTVRAEVCDPGPGFEVDGPPIPDEGRSGGWGLYMVDRLSDRWGVIHERSTRVWFELDI